jgi:hypothetical protein
MTNMLAFKPARKSGPSPAKTWLVAAAVVLCSVASFPALAAATGEVIHVSGTLSVMRPDGSILVLGQKSEVFPGDLLSTQKDSYAQINFSDGSSLTMRPFTQVRLDAYTYVPDKPEADNVLFRLFKGGMRTVTGLIGKRGNQNAYRIGTSTATIGIRGSTGDTMVCNPNCDGVAKGGEALPSGTHHQTHAGVYTMQIEGKAAAFYDPASGDRVLLAQAQIGDSTVISDEPPRGGRIFLAQATPGFVVIEEGHTGYSNGVEIKVVLGGIGGGKVDLYLPTAGSLKAAGCK